MASVEFKEVGKSFDDVQVVRELSLDIVDGEFLVLVGPSGCGKSTTLRMLAGLETPDRGDIFIGGRCVNQVAPKDRDIGMVFQSYALYPHMTVFENMAFALKLRKESRSDIDATVGRVARMLGLEELLTRRPSQLSGGQRQRVAMGRALVREPSVFLFDEPLSNLDAALRVEMRAELSALHRQVGTTKIYVTHDQVEAMTLGDRIAVLNAGVLQQCAEPLELYERPANTFVAGFMGTPSMNFIEGIVTFEEGNAHLQNGVLRVPLAGVASSLQPGEGLTLGVRPSALRFVRATEGDFLAEVAMIEPMGWEARVHCLVRDKTIVAQVESSDVRTLRVGDSVGVKFSAECLYGFDTVGDARWWPKLP